MINKKREKISFREEFEVKNETDKRILSPDRQFDLSNLTKKQLIYWRMLYPTSGVLFLMSEPGIAKSATLRDLAEKIIHIPTGKNLRYIDLRLSMLDETDVGLFPDKGEYTFEENGEIVKRTVLDHIAPRWAYLANEAPTLIHFEELNRAPLSVRNAALQILLEREIGYDFKFNKNVFMVSTGNLGEEDGTDVEEFDSALNGRLIHYKHTLTLSEWIDYYAKDNIQSPIINYLEKHIDKFYIGKKARKEGESVYASPRTWTFLSDYITANYGSYDKNDNYVEPRISDWIQDVATIAHSYIGATASNFIKYLNDLLKISIDDILNRYSELKKNKVKFNRDKKSDLLHDLRNIDIKNLKPNQITHIKMFLLDLQPDETSAYLLYLLDEKYEYVENTALDKKKNAFIIGFLKDKKFKKFHKVMLNHIDADSNDDSSDDWD
jgi:hypothetical protein